jgi:ATP-binding cassette subfamily F protein 3
VCGFDFVMGLFAHAETLYMIATKNASNINEALAQSKTGTTSEPQQKAVNENRLSYEAEKQMQKQRRKLEKLVEDDEKAINELEGAISALETVMSTVEGSTEENFTKYASLKKQLDEVVERWETNMMNLEELN